MEDRAPNGQPLMDENPDHGRAPAECVHCGKVTEDGYDIELSRSERGAEKADQATMEAFLCDDCMEDREAEWGNDELVNGMEGICDIVDVSNYLEPTTRVERATAAVMRLHDKAAALDAFMAVAEKAGMLMQAHLDENPYCFIPGGPESHDKEVSSDSALCITLRGLVKAMAPDPMKWERDQLVKRAMNAKQSLRGLYSEREMYEKGHLGYLRNIWAIPDLEALLQKTLQEIGDIILKRPGLL